MAHVDYHTDTTPPASEELRAKLAEAQAAREAADPIVQLKAQLADAEAREASERAKAEKGVRDRADSDVRKVWAAQAKAARKLQGAIAAYVDAYRGLVSAGVAARKVAMENNRAQQNLLGYSVAALTALEIARVNAGAPNLPPGADGWRNLTGDPRTIEPIESHFEALAAAIIPPSS